MVLRHTGWPPGPTVAVGVTFMTGRRKAAGLLEMMVISADWSRGRNMFLEGLVIVPGAIIFRLRQPQWVPEAST
jgi:hypothetical protein